MLSKSISILELMVKDHRKIEELIEKLEEESKNDFVLVRLMSFF